MQGSAICCHEHCVVGSDKNGVMTTPAANNGYDNVTELPVTSQWVGNLWNHKYALIWCDSTSILWMSNNVHIFVQLCDYHNKIVLMAAHNN